MTRLRETHLRNETHPWWRKRTIVIPPETRDEWVRLVTWELRMGLILFLLVALGMRLIMTSPDRLVPLSTCRNATRRRRCRSHASARSIEVC